MSQTVEFVLDAKDAGLVRAWLNAKSSVMAYEQSLGGVDQAQKKAAQSAAEQNRELARSQQIIRSLETAEESLARQRKELEDLHQKGLLTAKQMTDAMKRLADAEYAESDAAKAQAAAHRQLGEVARNAIRATESASDRYRQSVTQLTDAKRAGLLTEEQFSKALRQQRQQLLDASGRTAERAAAEKAAADKIKEAEQQKQRAVAAAQAVINQTRTASENYRSAVATLGQQLKSGLIDQETYNRALRAEREELVRSSGRLDERKRKEKELADLQKRVLDDIRTPQQRFNQQIAQYNELKRAGKLNEEQFAAAVKKSRAELDSTGKAGATSLEAIGSRIGVAAAGFVTVSTAVQGIRSALTAVMESNKDFINQAEEAGRAYDKLFRQFRIQADLRGLGGQEAQTRIVDIAEKTAFPIDRTTAAATALVSAGVAPQEASGGALESFLNTLNAQGLRDSDPTQFAESIAQYLGSQGMDVNTANMEMLGVQLQSMKDTRLKLTDLPQLAQIGAGLKGKLTEPEQVATFGQLGNTIGYDIAATRMADIFKNLSIAGGKTDAVTALKTAGLKPEQIDFNGENLQQVMETFTTALNKLAPEKQDQVLAKVIEGGNISTFRLLQEQLPTILDRSKNLNDVATYQADVKEGSSGRNAAAVRQEVRRTREMVKHDTQSDLLRDEIRQRSLERGDAPVVQGAATIAFNAAKYLGADNRTSATVGEAVPRLAMQSPGILRGIVASGAKTAIAGPFSLFSDVYDSGKAGGRILEESSQAARVAEAGVQQRLEPSEQQVNPQLQKQNVLLAENNRLLAEQNRLANKGAAANKPNTAPPMVPAAKGREPKGGRP